MRLSNKGKVLAVLFCAALCQAQEPSVQKGHSIGWDFTRTKPLPDRVELLLTGGGSYIDPSSGTEISADSVVATFDRGEYKKLFSRKPPGLLPRRTTILPSPRRTLTEQVIRSRLESLLQAMGQHLPPPAAREEQGLRMFRSLYLEGNVVIVQDGVELLQADSVFFSTTENRTVIMDAELRLITSSKRGPDRVLVVRAPKLVRQGTRTTGRDVSLTTCSAGKPHFEVFSGEVEIIERKDEFEVFTRNNTLALSGRKLVPLPNAHFFTSEQSQIPIKGFRIGYSQIERFEAALDLGGSMNEIGAGIHEFLTGRPGSEFQGDWRLGLGYNEVRGFPLDAELRYEVDKLYRGRAEVFRLGKDGGVNLGEIRDNFDGSRITRKERYLIHTENRIYPAQNWTLDLSVFQAGDPAVYPEFYRNQYYEDETPETSVHLRHAVENRLFTTTGRFNLTDFSYDDDGTLAPSFVEELPVLTYDWFSQPILALTEDVDLLLTSSTNAGWLRRDWALGHPNPINDETFRVDQELELTAPFYLGPMAFRPWGGARITHYDEDANGEDRYRWSFDAGLSAGTRLSRTWSWLDGAGQKESLRHTIYPVLSFGHRFKVDGSPTDFFPFDAIDALDEKALIRIGILNRLQLMSSEFKEKKTINPFELRQQERRKKLSTSNVREFVFLDLAQNILPISGRDNQNHTLGLFEYELILRQLDRWIPIPNLQLLIEGEHDWNAHQLRTFNSALRFGKVLGLSWIAEYRTDKETSGTVGYGAHTDLFGRWMLTGYSQYDIERKEVLDYSSTLTRLDHDWTLRVVVSFDVIRDETTFGINFEPSFGGLFRQRARYFGGTTGGRGADALLNY